MGRPSRSLHLLSFNLDALYELFRDVKENNGTLQGQSQEEIEEEMEEEMEEETMEEMEEEPLQRSPQESSRKRSYSCSLERGNARPLRAPN